mgnify:FL=1
MHANDQLLDRELSQALISQTKGLPDNKCLSGDVHQEPDSDKLPLVFGGVNSDSNQNC